MSTLTSMDGVNETGQVRAHPGKTSAFSRHGQALLTSTPIALADLGALAGCYLLATAATNWLFGFNFGPGVWNNIVAVCLCHMLVGTFLGLFPASGINPVCELRNQLTSIGVSFLMLVSLNGLLGQVTGNEILTIALAMPLAALIAPICRFSMRRLCAPFRWWGERVILVGGGRQGRLVYEFLSRQAERGLKPVGVVDDMLPREWKTVGGQPFEVLGKIKDLVEICRSHDCHWVIAAVADKSEEQVRQILAKGSQIPSLVVLNSNMMMPTLWTTSFDAAGLSGFQLRDRILCPFQQLLKRSVDIFLSGFLLLVGFPLWLSIAIWVRMKAGGPVLFRHQRIGRSGKPFGAWKFRTMIPNSAQILQEYLASNPAAKAEWELFHKLKNDPRVIPGIGAFLRRTSFDELPQLWNVLVGDMSLVGPRPVYTEDEIRMYGELYHLYLRVQPGLTGLWQVSGRNNTTFADKVWLDTYYVMNWSAWLDYFILLRTIRTVLFREGSY